MLEILNLARVFFFTFKPTIVYTLWKIIFWLSRTERKQRKSFLVIINQSFLRFYPLAIFETFNVITKYHRQKSSFGGGFPPGSAIKGFFKNFNSFQILQYFHRIIGFSGRCEFKLVSVAKSKLSPF